MRLPSRLAARAFGLSAGLVLLAAGAASADVCGTESMRSPGSNEPTQFTVVNDIGDRTARLYWIDFEGQKKLYAEIPPHGRHQQQTYRGHIWVSENSYGYCDLVFIPHNHAEIIIR